MAAPTKPQRRIHSQAQRTKLQQLVKDGKLKQSDLDAMEAATPKHAPLPERK